MGQDRIAQSLGNATALTPGRSSWKESIGAGGEGLLDLLMGIIGVGPDTDASKIGQLLGAAPMGAGMVKSGGTVLEQVATALSKRIKNPIKAYHGSPHDFDQFSLSKIGTGEGAQAYGHGLYFADQEQVARNYKPKPIVVFNSPAHGGKHAVMAGNETISVHTSADAANKAMRKALSLIHI